MGLRTSQSGACEPPRVFSLRSGPRVAGFGCLRVVSADVGGCTFAYSEEERDNQYAPWIQFTADEHAAFAEFVAIIQEKARQQ
jgi:hypothetical protein